MILKDDLQFRIEGQTALGSHDEWESKVHNNPDWIFKHYHLHNERRFDYLSKSVKWLGISLLFSAVFLCAGSLVDTHRIAKLHHNQQIIMKAMNLDKIKEK